MPIGDGTEALDTPFYAYYRLPEDGYDVVVAAPQARLYHTVLHEIHPTRMFRGTLLRNDGYHLRASMPFAELRAEDFVGAFVSGGVHRNTFVTTRISVGAYGKSQKRENPLPASVTVSEILTAADCIQGKRVTTVPKCQMDAEQGGACYVDQDVVLDGKLITGRGYAENTEVLKAFLRVSSTRAELERKRRRFHESFPFLPHRRGLSFKREAIMDLAELCHLGSAGSF